MVRFALEGQTQDDGSRFKVPQMGWNRVRQTQQHALWDGIPDEAFFYFVHSYYAVPADPVAERRAYEAMQLHGRLVTAEEIADAVAYLASPGASSTMGAALVVDGGYIVR